MRIEIGCRFDYRADGDVPAIILVAPHSSLRDSIVEERFEADGAERFEDVYGNVCRRLTLPQGVSSFTYHATVQNSGEPEETPGPTDIQHLIEDLPSEHLHWLLPSRFCESDALGDRAWELFGSSPRGAERVQAVCDWIHANIEYGTRSVPTTTAAETLELGGGMCRDFAHLGVTFCRALGIPARYVFGYLPDIGIPGPFPTMDFHAWFETWLGGCWWTFDARFNVPRIGRVAVGYGRDAVDVAMVTTYGAASLERMTVWADEASVEPEVGALEARDGR